MELVSGIAVSSLQQDLLIIDDSALSSLSNLIYEEIYENYENYKNYLRIRQTSLYKKLFAKKLSEKEIDCQALTSLYMLLVITFYDTWLKD